MTYKKVDAYNKWAKAYESHEESSDFDPITVEDVLIFSDKMDSFTKLTLKHDMLKKRIEDEIQGKYDYTKSQ